MERGDYEVIRSDGQVVDRSDFASTLEPGIVVEMSIILHRDEPMEDSKGRCPRCKYINRSASTAGGGWIEWKVSTN